jgi:hypothetical protein
MATPVHAPTLVIVCYRPRPGAAARLEALCLEHVPALRALGLVTQRPETLMRATDGTVVEVFEWASAAAMELAHHHPDVQALWAALDDVCTQGTLHGLTEAAQPFATFTALG